MSDDLERYATELAASPDYRVLRRLQQKFDFNPDDSIPTRIAISVDCEATGLDLEDDEVIEIGLVRFSYDATGRIHRILDTFDQFRQPKYAELSDEITQLTGITWDMVKGQSISAEDIERFVDGAVVMVAHNCGFDAPRLQRLFPVFKRYCWADSLTQIDWKAEGYPSARLGDILAGMGLFHEGHRASADAEALVACLSQTLPVSGKSAFGTLLERARRPTTLVMVEHARRHADFLKHRGFRWYSHGAVRQWRLETSETAARIECALIAEDYPGAQVSTRRLTAFNRFSEHG